EPLVVSIRSHQRDDVPAFQQDLQPGATLRGKRRLVQKLCALAGGMFATRLLRRLALVQSRDRRVAVKQAYSGVGKEPGRAFHRLTRAGREVAGYQDLPVSVSRPLLHNEEGYLDLAGEPVYR